MDQDIRLWILADLIEQLALLFARDVGNRDSKWITNVSPRVSLNLTASYGGDSFKWSKMRFILRCRRAA